MVGDAWAKEVLEMLDEVRRAGATASTDGARYRVVSASGDTFIAYSAIRDDEIEAVVGAELEQAREHQVSLEWEIYAHDQQERLCEHLVAQGFVAEPTEKVLVLPANDDGMQRLDAPEFDIRRVRDPLDLEQMAEISRETGRTNVDAETKRLADGLRHSPSTHSIYLAFRGGEPVACGRLWFPSSGPLAWLCGGRTKTTHRRRGLYTALVRQRVQEAIERGCQAVLVDALPMSEKILLKRGFEAISASQVFCWTPSTPRSDAPAVAPDTPRA